jgi:hypothetical protein
VTHGDSLAIGLSRGRPVPASGWGGCGDAPAACRSYAEQCVECGNRVSGSCGSVVVRCPPLQGLAVSSVASGGGACEAVAEGCAAARRAPKETASVRSALH